jgi:hypothetical protein
METTRPDIGQTIAEEKTLSEETETALASAIDDFKATVSL